MQEDTYLIKPAKLLRGDKIAIWSPSLPGAARYQRRLNRGVNALNHLGFVPVLSPLCCADALYVAAAPQELADELHELIINPAIKCIMASMGGWTSIRILPLLDFNLIRRNPKIYLGYSDIVSLLLAIYHRSNIVTFHGPAVLSEMGEEGGPHHYTTEYFLRTLMSEKPIGRLAPPNTWSDEFLAWDIDDNRPREPKSKAEWAGIAEGEAVGALVGGCIPTVDLLFGTSYFPDTRGSILFLENEGMRHDEFCSYLTSFKLRGMFSEIKGLIFGRSSRPNYYTSPGLDFKQIVIDCLGDLPVPIAWNIDLGHTQPMLTLAIGIQYRLRIKQEEITFEALEGAVL